MATYIAELIGLAIVAFVLGKWVVPVLNKSMTERQDTIRQQLEEAEEAKRRLAAAREEHGRALAEARREAERLAELAHEQGEAILVEMREQAQTAAQRIVEQAHQQIEADHQKTLNELHVTVGRITVGLAGRIVEESMTDEARQGRVIDRFLDEIEERSRRASEVVGGGVRGGSDS